MKVAFLHDEPGYLGGAELTMWEFAQAAPEGVEVVSLPEDCDRAVIGNCVSFSPTLIGDLEGKSVYRYHHDLSPHGDPELRKWLDANATHIFCSPLQRSHYPLEGEWPLIPPALDLDRFNRHSPPGRGAVCIGRMAYGKGLELLAEYPEPVDVYSTHPIRSEGSVRFKGASEDPAETLSHYERFVFLPTVVEPFGRAVVEAWAAGLQLILNRNVGARYWIEENPEGLRTATKDFWKVVCG